MPSLPAILSTALLLLLAPLTNTIPTNPLHARNPTHEAAVPKAVYFITNDRTNNSIIALPVSQDGTLSAGTRTPTGGIGSNNVGTSGNPLTPDALGSEGPVRVAGNLLFAVNAGSNTLSLFTIDPQNPLHITPLGPPNPTRGEFPVTVAVSLVHSLVCVGSTGAVSGIACAPFSAHRGLGQFDALRPINLNQTTPPTGPANEIGNVLFNDGETKLLATVKGPAFGAPGFISVFPVVDGVVSTVETRTYPSGTTAIFASASIPGTNSILTADAGFGAVKLDISALNNTVTTVASVHIPGQSATCWATYSSVTGTGFVTDVRVNRLVELDLTDLSVVAEVSPMNGYSGMTDLQAVGNFVYALSARTTNGSAAVAVFDISGGRGSVKLLQTFVVAGTSANAVGMAVLGAKP